jgi:hypothetical protein
MTPTEIHVRLSLLAIVLIGGTALLVALVF